MKGLSCEGLTKSYKGRKVVDNVSLQIRQGEIVGLLGPNGAGKTTSFYMIVGQIKPEEGTVQLEGKDITGLPIYKRARLGIGYLPQEASVYRNATVEQNITLAPRELGKSNKECQALADELIGEFGLNHIRHTPGYALSGGERRRVEIARALALEPQFLLLDEPFSGIDPIAVYDIQQLIVSLRDQGFGVLITDHNVRDTLAITDSAYLIHRGGIVISGTPQQVANSEVARKYYLGERFEL